MGNCFFERDLHNQKEYVDFIENENIKMKIEINRLRKELGERPAEYKAILLRSGIVVSSMRSNINS